MDNFMVALIAVTPLVIYMLIGYFLQRIEKFEDSVIANFNKIIFKVMLPSTIMTAVYRSNISEIFNPKFFGYAMISVLAVCALAAVVVCTFVKDNRKRGAMIQASYRSNYLLLGAPIVENIYGPDSLAIPFLLSAFIIPLYNVLAVFILETFRDNHKGFNLLELLKGIIRNPMIVGALIGFVLKLFPPLPGILEKTMVQLSSSTTPIALIVLGASFSFSGAVREFKELAFCVVTRLIAAPALVIGVGVLLGFRTVELASLLGMSASPCAVASFAMAQQMDSDGELAGNALVFTTLFSSVTMFLWVFFLKSADLL
jgi:predicted permease